MSAEPCIHAHLRLQLVVPEDCFVAGDIGAWYKCQKCGEEFSTMLTHYAIQVVRGPREGKS